MSKSLFSPSYVAALFITLALPAFAQDVPSEGDYVVRINRLETQVRQLAGQVEELQFANKRLEDTLKKFEQDIDMRFQDLKASPSAPSQPKAGATDTAPLTLGSGAKTPPPSGQPQGTLAAQAANAKQAVAQPAAQPAKPADAKSIMAQARAAFETANFDEAGRLARSLIQSFPKDTLVIDAMVLAGDSEFRLKRYPESAQLYLKVTQANANSKAAQLAFAKLGDALVSMGQKTQACAAFGEFVRRYPDADAALKARVDKAQKGAGC